ALSRALSLRGAYEQADEQAGLAVDARSRVRDVGFGGHILNQRGATALSLGRVEEAERDLRMAIEAFRAIHDQPGEAGALCILSQVHLELGHPDSAIELARRGVAMYESLGPTLRLANGKYALAVTLTQIGKELKGSTSSPRADTVCGRD
ncbi:tetratricopeptide repeat protein, partial [Streptomyces sp. 2MCAF27]